MARHAERWTFETARAQRVLVRQRLMSSDDGNARTPRRPKIFSALITIINV